MCQHARNIQGCSCALTLLLLLSGCLLSGGTASSGCATSSRGGTTSGTNVQEQVLDVLALESLFHYQFSGPWYELSGNAHLGEQRSPDGLNTLNLGSADESLELVGLGRLALGPVSLQSSAAYSDFDTVIGEDEGRVGGGEFGGGHCDGDQALSGVRDAGSKDEEVRQVSSEN